MKFILFVLASFICSTSFSQVDTLFYDKDYKGVLLKDSCDYWRVADYENKVFVDYYNTGEVKAKGQFSYIDRQSDLDSKFEGTYFEFYKTGVLEGYCDFKDGRLEGECATYFPDGNVKEVGMYKDWKKEGLFFVYNEPGGTSSTEFYINDERCDCFSEPYRVMMALKGERFESDYIPNIDISHDKKKYRRFDKYIRAFDLTKHLLDKNGVEDASDFWNVLLSSNPSYQSFYSKDLSIKTQNRIQTFKLKSELKSEIFNDYPTLFCTIEDSLLYDDFIRFFQGDNPIKYIKSIRLDASETKNAFVYPDGTICITSSLFYSLKPEELLGILAHEMAHYVLEHALISCFKVEKRERNNRIAAAVLSSVNVIAHASIQANGGINSEDQEEYWDNVNKQTELFFKSFDVMSERYKYRYSREQEMEADIVAYRFLQYMGYNPRHYINALGKILDFDISNPSIEGIEALSYDYHDKDEYSTHPSILERCVMLEYIDLYDKNRQSLE